ncbi:putative HAF family extracellular repeat protein [Pseudomonas sp. TE3786]
MKSLPFSRSPLAQALFPWRLIPAAVLSTLTLLAAQPAGAVMMDLGNLPGASGGIEAQAISGDGKVVVGDAWTQNLGYMLFSQSATQGLIQVGRTFGTGAYAYGVSSDGTSIVGTAQIVPSSPVRRAFLWSASSGFKDLGTLGGEDSDGRGISDDGSVVVGGSANAADTNRAFRWTAGGGMQDLGSLVQNGESYAFAVSGDGNVVVGRSDTAAGVRAVIWNNSTGVTTNLGSFGGTSEARAANRDGSVVVGDSSDGANSRAFRWTLAGGLQNLGTLGGARSYARDVNADGSVVVGGAQQADGATRAYRWTQAGGMTNLGVLTGQTVSEARGVSDDGHTVVGTSGNRAFIWSATDSAIQDLSNVQVSQIISSDTLYHLTSAQNRRIRDLNQTQCIPGATQRYCLSAGLTGYKGEATTSGTQGIGQVAAGLRLNEHWALGASAQLANADLNIDSAKQDKAYALSLWGSFQQNADNLGWNGNASLAMGNSDSSFERGIGLTDVQRARATTTMSSAALRAAVGYGLQAGRTRLTPELALSHGRTDYDGFTERNVAFPLTINSGHSTDTYATLGVRSDTPISAKGTVHLNLAVDTLLNDDTPAIEGSSAVPGLSRFTYTSNLDKRRVVPVAMAGYSHAIDANSTLGGGVQVATAQYQGERAVFGLGVQYRYAF